MLLRPFGVREVIAGDSIRSPEELRALVDEAEGSGVIPRAQEELLHNVFDFASLEVQGRARCRRARSTGWTPR